jgi:hypothetical protein
VLPSENDAGDVIAIVIVPVPVPGAWMVTLAETPPVLGEPSAIAGAAASVRTVRLLAAMMAVVVVRRMPAPRWALSSEAVYSQLRPTTHG